MLDKDAQPALESSAGYQQFLIGAPHYLLLMSARHIHAGVNAGYMMEDLVLKLTELDIDTCWLTFTDSDKIKKALSLTTPLEVAAIVAFGYGEKTAKKLRMNIQSMSQIDVQAEQQYYAPKKSVHELVHMESWSNKSGLDEMMDFYDDTDRACVHPRKHRPCVGDPQGQAGGKRRASYLVRFDGDRPLLCRDQRILLREAGIGQLHL